MVSLISRRNAAKFLVRLSSSKLNATLFLKKLVLWRKLVKILLQFLLRCVKLATKSVNLTESCAILNPNFVTFCFTFQTCRKMMYQSVKMTAKILRFVVGVSRANSILSLKRTGTLVKNLIFSTLNAQLKSPVQDSHSIKASVQGWSVLALILWWTFTQQSMAIKKCLRLTLSTRIAWLALVNFQSSLRICSNSKVLIIILCRQLRFRQLTIIVMKFWVLSNCQSISAAILHVSALRPVLLVAIAVVLFVSTNSTKLSLSNLLSQRNLGTSLKAWLMPLKMCWRF